MSSLLNLVWFIFFGWYQGLFFLLIGCLFYITIIGIPIGTSMFQLSKLIAFPFGKALVKNNERGDVKKVGHSILNILWFPFGLIISISCLLISIPLFIGIITIPVAIVYVRIAKFSFSPFGIQVITKEEALARRTAEILIQKQGNISPQLQENSENINAGLNEYAGLNTNVGTNSSGPNQSQSTQTENNTINNQENIQENIKSAINEVKRLLIEIKTWINSNLTPERKEKIRTLYNNFRIIQRRYVSDLKFFLGIGSIICVVLIILVLRSILSIPEYFVGKDVITNSEGKIITIDSYKPITGKAIFKKDGNILLKYATVINGYIDILYETYANGNPKSEIHTTYDWNKDTKSEYKKEWYEDGKMKTYDRFDKTEKWYTNGQKSYENEKYVESINGQDKNPKLMLRGWDMNGNILREAENRGNTIISDTAFTYESGSILIKKETNFYLGAVVSKTITEEFYSNGKMQRYFISGEIEQKGYENGDIKSIMDIKSGSGTSFYSDNRIQEHTESGSYLKKGYYLNGNIYYDYLGQIGKTFSETGVLVEECKITTEMKTIKYKDCGILFCTNETATEPITAPRCYNSQGKYLYDPPSNVKTWKSIKPLSETGALIEN